MLSTRLTAKDVTMLLNTHEASVLLEDGQMLRLTDAEGMALHATSGTLWVTQDGDPRDHILTSGNVLLVRHSGRTLITAVAGSAALTATRRASSTWSALWRNLRARLAHGALASARLRPMMHE